MDTKPQSGATNCNVQVERPSTTAKGDASHSNKVDTSRLLLVTVSMLLILNVVCLSYAFWRLGEQADEISQLRTATIQVTSSKATLQRRSDSESSQDQQQQQADVRHGHSTSSKPCHHGSCRNGNKDKRPPPISLGSTGQYAVTAGISTGLPAAHLVGSNSDSKFLPHPGNTPLPFRVYNDGFVKNQMSTSSGALTAPTRGLYFVYAQVYFTRYYSSAPGFGLYRRGRQIAHTVVSLSPTSIYATGYVGRLVCMNEHDDVTIKMSVRSTQTVNIGLDPERTFFGAFFVSTAQVCNS